jgi:circadian clock protein KaiB
MPTTCKNRGSRTRKKEYVLKLFVTGATRRSQVAITNLNAICEEYLQGRYELEVVDVYQSPLVMKEAGILATPTLVKQLPLPARKLIGDLSERGRVLMVLDVRATTETHGQESAVSQ